MRGKLNTTIPPGKKHCPRCNRTKKLDAFSKATKSRDGRFTYCRKCLKTKNAGRTPELRQRWHLAAKYGITPEQYFQMVADQNGKCAICKLGDNGKDVDGRWLAVDHNHQTGKVRQLLCGRCNTFLVLVEEKPELIPVMVEYLSRHNEPRTDAV